MRRLGAGMLHAMCTLARGPRVALAAAALCLVCLGQARAQGARVSQEAVDEAVDRGSRFLLARHKDLARAGQEAELVLLTLIHASRSTLHRRRDPRFL